MKKIFICALVSLSLSGCAAMQKVGAGIGNAWSVATGASVPASSVVITSNTLDALEATATNYLSLPLCGTAITACRNRAATRPIENAVRAARVARNNLEAFQRANPGQLGASGLYNALQSAVSTLQGVLAQYGVEDARI